MSVEIRNDHPWNEFEKRYHYDRNQDAKVKQNEKDFPPGSESKPKQEKTVQLEEETVEYVKSLSDEDLVKELESRGLSTDGSEKEQKIRLATWIQNEKDNAD